MGAFALAASAAALASPQFVSTFTGAYSAQTPGTPSGLDALATWSDPGEPGGKPKEIQKIKVIFNPGATLDTRALPTCNASREDIAVQAVRACPAKTKVGEVRGQGVYAGGAPFNTYATLFNAKGAIIVVVTLDDAKGRLLTDFRDDVRKSSITVNLKIGRGISLIRFQAHVPRPLPQARQEAQGLLPDAPLVSPERRLDHDVHLQLPGRHERPALIAVALPRTLGRAVPRDGP